jgi:hypothetical protein
LEQKIFVIGLNKTGTTTLKRTFEQLNFKVSNQQVGEAFTPEIVHGDFTRLKKYCEISQVFQDVPFMLPNVYQWADRVFPGSKFVLSVRDNPNQWYESLVNFHTKLFSSDKSRPPDEKDLFNSDYLYKGYVLDNFKFFWNYPSVSLYDKEHYIKVYKDHIEHSSLYFKNRDKDFIIINVSYDKDLEKLKEFLNVKSKLKKFPWENKT